MSYYNDEDAQDNLVVELSKAVSKLKAENKDLKKELEARDKVPIPKSVIQQIVQLQAIIQKLESDIKYYKKHVPVQVIINKEQKEKPTRRGGIPK